MTTTTTTTAISLTDASAAMAAFEAGLRARFLERADEIRGMILGLIARQNVLLLGPPGTAKSALTTAFSDALGWRAFVRLMGRTTVPEEVFGPFSLSALENDRYERCVDGYLPTAQVAFLDEVFKANSAILNSLLTALNERAFDQGPARISIPLELAIGASNEYPQDDGLAALYDRFLVRFWVDYLRSEDGFSALLLAEDQGPLTLDPGVVDALRAAARGVDVAPVVPVIVKIRSELSQESGITVSDRRWRQSLSLVRAAAALDGRTVAHPRDLSVLADCLWDRHEQRAPILATVIKFRSPVLAKVTAIHALAEEAVASLPSLSTISLRDLDAAGKALDAIERHLREARSIMADEGSALDVDAAEVVAKIGKLGDRVADAVTSATTRKTR